MIHNLRNAKKWMTLFLSAVLVMQPPLANVTVLADTVSGNESYVDIMDTSNLETTDYVSQNAAKEQTEGEKPTLNYIYIQEVMQQDAQDGNVIVASIGDEEKQYENVSLILSHVQTGERLCLNASKGCGGAYEFDTKEVSLSQGIYRVAAVTGETEEGSFLLDLSEIPGMEQVQFGVEQEPGIETENLVSLESFSGEGEAGLDAQQVAGEANSGADSTEMEGLLSIDVTDLSGASEGIADALAKAKADTSEETDGVIASERMQAGSVVIFLDPGHDSAHAGARANGINEEDITLKVAQYCKEYLTNTYTNVVVYMSRSTAACPHPGLSSGDDNSARVADAKSVNADAYVSIHFNSLADKNVSGAMVFYPNSNYNSSVGSKGSTLAAQIQEQLVKLGLSDRGIRIENSKTGDTYPDGSLADYYGVIRGAKKVGIPAVIVEHAFLTNASDAAFLKSEDNLKKLGIADALGIANAFSLSTEETQYDAEDLTVTGIDGANGSFQINLIGATPVERIDKVVFKVYPTQDTSLSYLYTAQADEDTEGTYTVKGSVSNHDMTVGTYKVIAYVYDAAGRKTQLRSTTFTIDEAAIDTSGMSIRVKKTTTQKKVTLTLRGNDGAADVYFKVSATRGGKKISKKINAEQKSAGWTATLQISDFKAMGAYTVYAYSKNYYGKTKKVCQTSFTIDGPSLRNVTVSNINLEKGTFRLKANKVQSASGIKKVRFQVKNLTGKKVTKTYAAKMRGSYYYADLNFKDFGYQLGKYQIAVTADDGNGISEQISKVNYTFEAPAPQITAKLVARETKLQLSAKNLGIGVNVKGVRFTVTHAGGAVKKKTYDAKNKSGVWSASVKVSDLAKSGTYKIQAYVKGSNGKYTKVGKVKRVTVSDIQGGKVTTKERSAGGTYLYVGSISANSTVSKVEVKAWPSSKSSARYTYTAKAQGSGKYRALIDPKNHKGVGGTYKYQVTVTLKNGVSERILSGKFAMDEAMDGDDAEDDFENEDGYHTITGSNGVTVAQMMAYYQANASYPGYYAGSDASTLKKFCTIYYNECKAENIRVEVAFVQAMKETNFLRYTGDVDIQQYNFAGIGATGGGAKGNSFSTVTLGIRAHIQHLKAYANKDPLTKSCVDPRFTYVARGTAPYVEWLGIPDNPYGKGWATAQNYGSSILQMISQLKQY